MTTRPRIPPGDSVPPRAASAGAGGGPGLAGLLLAGLVGLAAPHVAAPAAGQEPPLPAEEVAARERAPFDFYQRGPYREDVPRPVDFLGYRLGSLHTSHPRMLDYFRALERAAPERIELERYGRSYEGRPLLLAFVGSPEVLERRERIRTALQALAEPRGTTPEAAERIAESTPVVVWLDYANDADESANLEASMQVAYQLVAGEGDRTRRLRDSALVILNPDHNPDSHERHAAWYDAFGVGAADPAAMEHHAPWGMSTNNNHYQIDLNRDAWGLTQRESQALAAQVLRWRPQVFVDHHGQTEQYFFPPPVEPVNPDLPETRTRWYELFGRGNARAFDRRGWQYFTRDVFDLHYPGYWDAWPALHGAIGMTYETDGGGSRGLRWRREDGTVVTFRDGIARHWVASLATVETAVEHRRGLLEDYAAFFRTAVERGRGGEPARGYVLTEGDDPRRAAVLAGTLLRHGVEVRRASGAFRARARHHQGEETVVREFPEGSYLVDMAQPQGRVAATLLRKEVPLDSGFVRRQLARWSRNARRGEDAPREAYEFYDLTAWSLPLVFDVDAWALDELPEVEAPRLEPAPDRLAGSGGWSDEVPFDAPWLGGGVRTVVGPEGRGRPAAGEATSDERARSAYLFRPGAEGSLRLLARLLREGFRVAVARRPLMAGEVEYPRGTFVVRVSRNPARVHGRIRVLAREAAVPLTASHTAFPAEGRKGPGSADVEPVGPPRVAVLADEGVRTTAYGHTWFTLERRLAYPFTPLRFSALRPALERHDVLVVPDGSAAAYRDALGEEGLERLEGWIERGGVLVGWGGAAAFAVDQGLVEAPLVRREAIGEGATDTVPAEQRLSQIEALPRVREPGPPVVSPTARPGALQPVPGAILRGALDLSHWLTLGYDHPELAVLADGDDFLGLSPSGSSPVAFPEEGDLHLSGFVWPGNTVRLLAGSAHAVVERRGRGAVVLLASDPNFRLVWRATGRLFANAVLLGPSLGAEGGPGY